MIRTVEAVCTEAVAPALRATGLPVQVAGSADEAAERIREIAVRGEVGVVLLESPLHDELEENGRLPAMVRQQGTAILRFPGPVWLERPPEEEYLLELLRRAVGYRVKLR